MAEQNYKNLIGKTKTQIKEEFGDEFNFYPSTIWTYQIKKTWFGRKHVLFLHFNQEILVKVQLKKIFGTSNNSNI